MKKYLKNERGSQTLEFVGMFPLIVIAALVAWQILMAGYTMIVGEAAARDAARVASVDGNYEQAARNSASGLYVSSRKSDLGDSVEVTVTTKVPTLKIPIWENPNFEIEASAIMPVDSGEEDDD
ncbi:pilus assembly protein TadE [Lentibacillus cibarius]|uniref:Pilus assembly protein TadE n=1 Tax=Lentibacillus cibarius TaxID=2583219 RepID=A0A549YJL0_9BACI|nr:pilus assembly protein TadE [Lentibacillus cibarius]TRM12068.1 pilus assembly protein TadE [Lentibacillus cibarius]